MDKVAPWYFFIHISSLKHRNKVSAYSQGSFVCSVFSELFKSVRYVQKIWKLIIGDSVRPKNKFESQGENIQDSCKTSNDVRCRDVGSEESTREEVGCGGNEDVKMVSFLIDENLIDECLLNECT